MRSLLGNRGTLAALGPIAEFFRHGMKFCDRFDIARADPGCMRRVPFTQLDLVATWEKVVESNRVRGVHDRQTVAGVPASDWRRPCNHLRNPSIERPTRPRAAAANWCNGGSHL